MNGKTIVSFFPTAAAASCCDSSGTASPCDCGTGEEVARAVEGTLHPNEVLFERLTAVHRTFGERVEVETEHYSSNAGIFAAIDKLNAALLAGGKDFMVSPGNFYTFIATVAPLIVIDGKVAFTRSVPPWERLKQAIERALELAGVA